MSSSRRPFLWVNLILALAVAAMAWFLFSETQPTVTQSRTAPVMNAAPAPATAVVTTNMSAADTQAIEALQQQLQNEKSLADQARSQIQLRELEQAKRQLEQVTNQDVAKTAQPIKKSAPPPAKEPAALTAESAGLDVAEQKALIAEAIKAQLGGAESNDSQTLKKKLKSAQ